MDTATPGAQTPTPPPSARPTDQLKQSLHAHNGASTAADSVPQPWRGRDVVFIVPTDEVDATMGCTSLGPEEYLVKYFEDFK
ncbi:hypothetical protein EV174_005070 [Coemansia sp. RSA 2320]|nr:hypothetical protein EV174_005070 [Coemansia sp. RSA 2320]